MSKFLNRFIDNTNGQVDPDSKYVFVHDKWDKNAATKISDEIKEYRIATDDLKKITHTGYEAMVDTLYSLFKAKPSLRPPQEIRPSYMIDHVVMDVFTGLKEYEQFRPAAKGDPVNAGLAAVDLEPALETIFDQMESATALAGQIEEMLQQGEITEGEIQALLEAAQSAESDGEAQNYQEQAAALQEQLEALAKGINAASEDLNNLLEMQVPNIQEALKDALKDMNEKAEAINAFTSWGLNQGTLTKIDPQARVELSKKLGSEKFKAMADIIGKMQTLALTEQMNKTNYAEEEIYDIEHGDSMHRMLPAEYLAFCDEYLELDWMRRLLEQDIQQYALKGNENVEKGSIILLEDGSGSMTYNNGYIWAKGIALALLKIAFLQHRGFYGVQFGGPGKYCTFDFDTTTSLLGLTIAQGDQTQDYVGVQALVEYADKFLNNAGTDFMTPFSVALDRLNAEFEEKGTTEADIVFLTDGQCAVTQDFMNKFKAEQERLGFTVYGIAIGGDPASEPINELCAGKVISLAQLTSENTGSLAELFGAL